MFWHKTALAYRVCVFAEFQIYVLSISSLKMDREVLTTNKSELNKAYKNKIKPQHRA